MASSRRSEPGTILFDYASEKPHACYCIGCCPKCGTCRTYPGHTSAYCDFLVRQSVERQRFLNKQAGNS